MAETPAFVDSSQSSATNIYLYKHWSHWIGLNPQTLGDLFIPISPQPTSGSEPQPEQITAHHDGGAKSRATLATNLAEKEKVLARAEASIELVQLRAASRLSFLETDFYSRSLPLETLGARANSWQGTSHTPEPHTPGSIQHRQLNFEPQTWNHNGRNGSNNVEIGKETGTGSTLIRSFATCSSRSPSS
jgi:hypothetical protein